LLQGLKLKAAAGSLTDDDVVVLNGWFKAGKPAPSAQSDVLSGLQPGTPKR
jgi:hypothetical protein